MTNRDYLTTKVPNGVLRNEVHFAFSSTTWQELTAVLTDQAPNEACAFVLTRPSRGVERITMLGREIIWPLAGEVTASPYGLEVSADYISRTLDAAIDAGPMTGILLIHTHPKTKFGDGVGAFSPRDDWYEARLFATLTNQRPQSICGSIVLGSKSDVSARIWWNAGDGLLSQLAQIIRVVGPEIKFLETPDSVWKDHLDPEVMDRATRLWGQEGRRILQNLQIGVVGAGGTGSIAILACAQMGAGGILIWDKDVVKDHNRHRNLGTSKDDIGKPKAEVMTEKARNIATARPFDVKPFVDWGTTTEGLHRLRDCDVVFCCVDKLAPRVPLNLFAYLHLIPVLDMSSWIHPNRQGIVDAIMTHAHVWSPGIPCAWCKGTLSSRELTREAQGSQKGSENRIAYGLPLDQTDGVEPSVLPLNMVAVAFALMEFMQVTLNITARTPRDLKFILPEWELDESDLDAAPGCECQTQIAMGDAVQIQPVSIEVTGT